MKTKIFLKVVSVVVWIINFVWPVAMATVGVIASVALLKWATSDITTEALPMVKSLYVIALLGLICKFASKYWSDKGTTNGMELIKWNGKFPIFKKEVKDE
jgi:hypothetical protein